MENENAAQTTEQTFTQAELNAIVQKRVGEVNAKYADYEEVKAKATKYDELGSVEELQKAASEVDALRGELTAMKEAEEIRVMRDDVSKEYGIPASLLTATTKEECEAQAQGIKDFAKPKAYPAVRDSGEVNKTTTGSTRDQFANWFSEVTNGGN